MKNRIIPLTAASDRDNAVTIYFDNKPLIAKAGDRVASALLAAGINVLGHSAKYHRLRGPYCLEGRCWQCLARIDGVPNVRTCETTVRDGMRVTRQSRVNRLGVNPLAAIHRLFPDGFDYHTLFTNPSVVNQIFRRVVRLLVGQGRLPDEPATEPMPPISSQSVELAVIGGGSAGLSAARAAAARGIETLLLDDRQNPGGRLSFSKSGAALAAQLANEAASAGVKILSGALVLGWYDDGFFLVLEPTKMTVLTPRAVVMCPGTYPPTAHFVNNDLPGIFTLRGLQRLVNEYGIRPGRTAILYGAPSELEETARDLTEAGIELRGLISTEAGGPPRDNLTDGPFLYWNHRLLRAEGRRRIERITLAPEAEGAAFSLDCEVLAIGGPGSPAYELAYQRGCQIRYEPLRGGFVPQVTPDLATSVPGIFAAGEILGTCNLETRLEKGELAGRSAAAFLRPSRGSPDSPAPEPGELS